MTVCDSRVFLAPYTQAQMPIVDERYGRVSLKMLMENTSLVLPATLAKGCPYITGS